MYHCGGTSAGGAHDFAELLTRTNSFESCHSQRGYSVILPNQPGKYSLAASRKQPIKRNVHRSRWQSLEKAVLHSIKDGTSGQLNYSARCTLYTRT